MTELTNSNVEFFHSQSSFGSSAISNSRVQDLVDQLVDEAETIFYSLHQILVPRQDILNENGFRQIMHRANILYKQTIPENKIVIQRSGGSERRIADIKVQEQKLRTLLQHYEAMKMNSLSYEEFYNIYGRQKQGNFTKKQPMEINIQPDIVQIIEAQPSKSLKGGVNKNQFIASSRDNNKEKELQELKDEINKLKKKEKNFIKEKEEAEQRLKRQADERVKVLLKLHKINNQTHTVENLKGQILKTQEDLEKQYNLNSQNSQYIRKLEDEINELKVTNRILQDQLESNRRLALVNSRLSDAPSEGGRSVYSEADHGQSGPESKKYQKIIKNLYYEKNLLRNELNREREGFYKIKKEQAQEFERQAIHLKKVVERKNQQIAQLKKQMDKYKVQNIKLVDQNHKMMKQLGFAKNSVENLQKMTMHETRVKDQSVMRPLPSTQNLLDMSRTHKFAITQYTGDGDEGYPYYELLNKEFKIRFRRACLRDKQLLYKANGLQIGVISEYIRPNQIKIIAHLSNFCDQEALHSLRIRITNSKGNKVIADKVAFQKVDVGQQIKCPLIIHPKTYPLGSTVFICQYSYYGKKQEVRVLLPVHIFKMITIRPRDGEFRDAKTIKFPLERKIAKNIQSLRPYFKGCGFGEGKIQASLWHEQTETKILVDICEQDSHFILKSEHRSGEEQLSNYIIKTLEFLLKKQ